MSGGRFSYNQSALLDIAEDIQDIIDSNHPMKVRECSEYVLPAEIMARYKEAVYNLERVFQMVQRIDWLESQDDGPESFMERWDAEVPPSWEETFKSKQPQPK